VLDISAGRPAAGVAVTLEAQDAGGAWSRLAEGVTDADGRLKDLLPAGPLAARRYRLSFATGAWFAARGVRALHPSVSVTFEVGGDPGEPGGGHYHVPLLVSPFGYTTYRGS
jgi:5-hydroxyisourate hydrolase